MEQNTLSLVHIFGAQQHQQHSGDRIKLSDLRQHFFFHALRISFVEFISSSIATPWLTEILGTNPTIRPILHADGHSSLVFLLIICVVVFVWLLHSQMWVNDFGRNEGVCQKKKAKTIYILAFECERSLGLLIDTANVIVSSSREYMWRMHSAVTTGWNDNHAVNFRRNEVQPRVMSA